MASSEEDPTEAIPFNQNYVKFGFLVNNAVSFTPSKNKVDIAYMTTQFPRQWASSDVSHATTCE